MHHFLLHHRPRWQAGTHSLVMFIVTITTALSERLGSSGLWGSCCNARILCSSSSKRLCTLCTSVASCRTLSIFVFGTIRKIHPMVPATACCLVQQMGTHCNTFSMFSGEPFTASQSSTRAHTKRIMATGYHMLSGSHWLSSSSETSSSPIYWVSCQKRQLYH